LLERAFCCPFLDRQIDLTKARCLRSPAVITYRTAPTRSIDARASLTTSIRGVRNETRASDACAGRRDAGWRCPCAKLVDDQRNNVHVLCGRGTILFVHRHGERRLRHDDAYASIRYQWPIHGRGAVLDGCGVEYRSRVRVWEELLVQKHFCAHTDSYSYSDSNTHPCSDSESLWCVDAMCCRKRALFVHWQDDRALWCEHDCQ
jgi:hypothetical protein